MSEEHPCYHAFNDQTAKRQLGGTIWDIANPGNAYSQAHVVKLRNKTLRLRIHPMLFFWGCLKKLGLQNKFTTISKLHQFLLGVFFVRSENFVPLRQVSVWNLFIGAAPVTSNEHVRWEIVRWGVGSLHVEKLVSWFLQKKIVASKNWIKGIENIT